MQMGFGDGVLAYLNASDWVSIGAAFVAMLCLLACRATFRRQETLEYERLRAARESDLIRWSDEAICALAEAERLCVEKDDLFKAEDFRRRQSETTSLLSSLVDRGLLFFPNVDSERYAERRTNAAGRKQDALEALYQAYQTLRNIDPSEKGPSIGAAAQRLFEQRKLFVEEVFGAIDPRRRKAAMTGPEYRRASRALQQRRRAEARQAQAAAA